MASQIQLENFYQTVLTSPTIAASGDVTFTVATPPVYAKGWMVISSENAAKREVMYYHSVVGSTISVRGVNRSNPKEHTQNEIVRINDVAEIFNFITGQISTAFYVEKTGGLNVTVWGGAVSYNGATQSFADTNLTLADNSTNYIKYNYVTNTVTVDGTNSGNIKAIVVVASGVITSISYLTPKESFIDFTVSITDALPSQTGNAGKALVTDGTNISWSLAFLNALRSGLSNWKLLSTNGTGVESYIDSAAADYVLTSNGTTAAPTFKTLPYASQAEAEAGTDNVKLVTPLRVAQYVPVASETVAGKVERATDAEVITGTDTTRYISPKQLKDNTGFTLQGNIGTSATIVGVSGNLLFTQTGVYVKACEIVAPTTGTYKCRWTAYTSQSGNTAYSRIYKNGVAFGTERGTTTQYPASPTYWEEELSFTQGDLIQLYGKGGGPTSESICGYMSAGIYLIPTKYVATVNL